ncbi:MAG: RNA polymerase sigma factor [Ferruginibacter sp.]
MNYQQLIQQAKDGDPAAEKALYDHLSGTFFSMCCRYVKNEADAEERMADGFFIFFKKLQYFKYESDGALYAYLAEIMVRECVHQLRKKQVFNIIAEPIETDAVLDHDMLDKLSTEKIQAIICTLPEQARIIFNLYVVEGWQHNEIADILGISTGTSKSQFARARQLLQKKLSFLKNDHEKHVSK